MQPEQYTVHIHWGMRGDMSFDSPPIGPCTHAQAEKLATDLRKKMRAAGRPWQGTVKLKRIVSPSEALGWEIERR